MIMIRNYIKIGQLAQQKYCCYQLQTFTMYHKTKSIWLDIKAYFLSKSFLILWWVNLSNCEWCNGWYIAEVCSSDVLMRTLLPTDLQSQCPKNVIITDVCVYIKMTWCISSVTHWVNYKVEHRNWRWLKRKDQNSKTKSKRGIFESGFISILF